MSGTALAGELVRLEREMRRIVGPHGSQTTYADEAPLRIHTRSTDEGHGLGGPEFHPSFLAWLGEVCRCGAKPECAAGCTYAKTGDRRDHVRACKPGCPAEQVTRFRTSDNRMHPRRLQRALRQLRQVSPIEFDLVYLIAGRGYSWTDATTRINANRAARKQAPLSNHDFIILFVAGADKAIQSY